MVDIDSAKESAKKIKIELQDFLDKIVSDFRRDYDGLDILM